MFSTPKFDRLGSPLFSQALADHNLCCRRKRTDVLQLNLGKLCNLTCVHCHVNAGPKRREITTRETVDRILGWLSKTDINTVDLTGGAPEMMPDFRYLVGQLREMPQVETIIDRCNLTILLEPGYEWLGDFLVAHHVKIVASMPCTGSTTSMLNEATASSIPVSELFNS
jgi:radical SAM/Cys-rich protein